MTAFRDDPRIARGMQTQLGLRRKRIAAGDRPIGWKVGFGAPAAKERLGIAAALVGFLTERARLQSGASVSLAGWTRPVAEPEIAIYIGQDLASGADRDAAVAAVAALGPAIELVDLERPPDDVEQILSGNIYQRHVVLGPRDDSRTGGVVQGLVTRVVRDGVETAAMSDVEANTGKLIDTVQHVADVLAAFGERLRAGEFIIAGSIVAPLMIEPGEKHLTHQLDPVGSVSVKFLRD